MATPPSGRSGGNRLRGPASATSPYFFIAITCHSTFSPGSSGAGQIRNARGPLERVLQRLRASRSALDVRLLPSVMPPVRSRRTWSASLHCTLSPVHGHPLLLRVASARPPPTTAGWPAPARSRYIAASIAALPASTMASGMSFGPAATPAMKIPSTVLRVVVWPVRGSRRIRHASGIGRTSPGCQPGISP